MKGNDSNGTWPAAGRRMSVKKKAGSIRPCCCGDWRADLKDAQALIMAGDVRVNGQKADKADPGAAEDEIAIQRKRPYVSRGALKIAKADP